MTNRILLTFLVLCINVAMPAIAKDRIVPKSKEQVQLSFAPVVKQTAPAVVNIHTKRTVSMRRIHPFAADPFFAPFFRNDLFGENMKEQIDSALGSGVIVDETGLVVTNAHVIRGADEITIILSDGREFEANLLIKDDASDLALLRAKTDQPLPHVSLKPSESLEVGDLVLAIGNPFGVGQTVTSGIVSAQGRSSLDINDFNFFIQTDAAINPGNSGGALVTLDGRVVGINTAIYSRDGGSLGIGFAIPSEMVASVIAAAQSGQTSQGGIIRPWVGVSAQSVTADIAESLGLSRPRGALINAMHANSPLKKAGIRVGDVVLSINGKDIRDAAEMKFRMATVPLGQSAKFKLRRQGKIKTLQVTAVAPPDDPPRETATLEGRHALNGVTIANINPAVYVELDMSGREEGVVVTNVPRATYAARFVSRGTILVEINGRKIKQVSDVQKALKQNNPQGLFLVTESAGRLRSITIR